MFVTTENRSGKIPAKHCRCVVLSLGNVCEKRGNGGKGKLEDAADDVGTDGGAGAEDGCCTSHTH